MKAAIALLEASCVVSLAQAIPIHYTPPLPNPLGGMVEDAQAQQAQAAWANSRHVIDPWRIINGTTNSIDANWCQFSGTVLQVHHNGIRVQGIYYCPASGAQYEGEFFVLHFPYAVAENDSLNGATIYCALGSGVYEYTTVNNSSRTLKQLDYGQVWTPPSPTPEQIEAQKQARRALAEKQKAEGQARALKFNQDSANKGDAYGELRMGERYRDGDGVARDLVTARQWLEKATAQGSVTASNELAALPKE
ncbi:MAG: hypothetical protein ABSE16_01440 [Verrucomicrobiota bacterium]|jgi:hypothetical protein